MTQIKETKSAHFKKIAEEKKPELGTEFGAVIENKEEKYPPTGGWKSAVFTVNEKCIGCGKCVRHCPEAAIIMKEIGGKKVAVIDSEFCKGCGICKGVCPVSAIESKNL